MLTRTSNVSILLICGVAILLAGCGGQAEPGVKKSRLIATENKKLQGELADRDKQIEKLKQQHEQELAKQSDMLDKCQSERDALKEQVKGQIEKQVEGVLQSVLDQNKMLRDQVEQLQAEMKGLKDKTGSK